MVASQGDHGQGSCGDGAEQSVLFRDGWTMAQGDDSSVCTRQSDSGRLWSYFFSGALQGASLICTAEVSRRSCGWSLGKPQLALRLL